MKKEIVIDFSPEGCVSALHMDEFPLSFLGRMDISRASTIDFNPDTQRFDINLKSATKYERIDKHGNAYYFGDYPPHPPSSRGFKGYDEARAYEVAWIQECMKRNVDPLDPEGVEIIDALRQASDSPQL